jgi:starch synthase (maltosyl-transferring)
VIGRIPIADVQPVVSCGQRPARAVVGEAFEVSATVFGIGHETIGAGVVLTGPDGQRRPLVTMREVAEFSDRYACEVTVTATGRWRFEVEAWADPVA